MLRLSQAAFLLCHRHIATGRSNCFCFVFVCPPGTFVHKSVLSLLLVMRVNRKRVLSVSHSGSHTLGRHVSSHEATFPQSWDHIHKCVSAALISQVSLPLEEQALISDFWFQAESLLVRMRAAVKHGCSNLHTKFSSKPSFVAHTVLALGCSFPL